MAGGIYPRPKEGKRRIWWCWWTERVKDPRTGKLKSKKHYASSQSTKRSDAVTLLSTKIHEARLQKPRFDLPDPTYEEVRDSWLRHREVEQAKKGVKVERLKNGDVYFQGRSYLDEYFGGWQASSIDTEEIEDLQRKLLARGLKNGINHVIRSLRAMLRYAVATRRLNALQLPDKFPMMAAPRREPQPIDQRFVKPLLAALDEPYRTAFALAYHSGMRLSEIDRLKWEHVDLARRRLYFPGAKTGEWRRVPLLADVPKLLAALSKGKPTDLLFPGFADRTARARAWRDAAVKVGLGAWQCRKCDAALKKMRCPEHGQATERLAKYCGPLFRFTRHTAIRNLTNRGVPMQRVMQMTGHKNVPTHMGYNVSDEADLDLIRETYDGKV